MIERNAVRQRVIGGIVMMLVAGFSAYADICYNESAMGKGVFACKLLVYLGIFLFLIAFYKKTFIQGACPYNKQHVNTKASYIKLYLILISVYMTYLVVFFPGMWGYDTINQIMDLVTGTKPLPFDWIPGQVEVSALMNDHHPVFTTVIFTAVYKMGVSMGHPELGMFIYCVIQIAVTTALFCKALWYLEKEGISRRIIVCSAVFYGMPFIAFYMITMVKDTMFSMFFISYYLILLEMTVNIIRNKETSNKQWLLLLALTVLVALSNKKGIYIVSLSNIALLLLVHGKRDRIRAAVGTVLPVVLMTVVLGHLVFPALNIYPGGRQESMGFAFQQVARTYIDYPNDFSKEDEDVLSNVLNINTDEIEAVYISKQTDPIKDKYNYYATEDDLSDFIKLWANKGVRHPKEYIKASLEICGGYFSLSKAINIFEDMPYYSSINAFRQPNILKGERETVVAVFKWLEEMPGLSLLFQNSTYTWFVTVVSTYWLLRSGNKRLLVLLTPIYVNLLFLLVGPICWTRYALCQFYSLPIVISLPQLIRETDTQE